MCIYIHVYINIYLYEYIYIYIYHTFWFHSNYSHLIQITIETHSKMAYPYRPDHFSCLYIFLGLFLTDNYYQSSQKSGCGLHYGLAYI